MGCSFNRWAEKETNFTFKDLREGSLREGRAHLRGTCVYRAVCALSSGGTPPRRQAVPGGGEAPRVVTWLPDQSHLLGEGAAEWPAACLLLSFFI